MKVRILKYYLLIVVLMNAFPLMAQLNAYGSAFKNAGAGDCYTITPNSGAQGGAVYDLTPIDLTTSFRIRIFVGLGSNDGGADGLAFVMRSNPTAIPVGLTGGSLGISGVNDSILFVEMDTWDNSNNNDVAYDHINIMRHDVIHNSYNNLAAPVMALPLGVNIEDGVQHELSVTWDAPKKELKVYFDCELRSVYIGDIVKNVFNGNPIVYHGVTAATGGATNLQTACFSPGINLPNAINATCGDTVLTIQLTSEDINCSSVDPDGTDFRLADSSGFNGNPASVKYLPVKSAQGINCNATDKTNQVKIKLWKPLHYGDYYLVIKKGNTMSSLSPFCSHPDLNNYSDFDVPEFTSILVRVRGNVPVQINDKTNDLVNPSRISICLPRQDPYPLLKAVSARAVDYYWSFGGDTIQNIDSLWANEEGVYKVEVKDKFGCSGSDQVTLYFPTSPEFTFDVPPYCDTILGGDVNNLPDMLFIPKTPVGGKWEWFYDFGPPTGYTSLKTGDSLLNPFSGHYRLEYTDTAVAAGLPPCVTTLDFELDRENYPPEAPLHVELTGDLFLCSDNDEPAVIEVVDTLLKPNFKAKPGYGPNTPYSYQWFFQGEELSGKTENFMETSKEGQYEVFVKDQYGCVGSDTVQLSIQDRYPAFEVFCEVLTNGRGRISWANISSAIHYEVSFDNGVLWEKVDSNFVVVDQVGSLYGVKVKAIFNNACGESEISDFYPCKGDVVIPNVFSPNGDDINDLFYIQALDLYPGSKVKILDRWGITVFSSDHYLNDWDGGDVTEGTYYYILELNDGRNSVRKGYVTLLR